MSTATLAKRLDALERANQSPGAIVVCWCSKHNGRVNVDDHEPDCPARAAGASDVVLIVRYDD